jgi:hypothetical protein
MTFEYKYIRTKRKNGNDSIILTENSNLKFSFVPLVWDKNDKDDNPIKATQKNKKAFSKYIESSFWQEFLKYNFDEMRPYYLPHYTSEMYYLDNISTKVESKNDNIMIVINGILKKYSYDEIKNKYDNNNALNKTWTEKNKKQLTNKDVIKLTKDGFYKSTVEGEMHISDIGQILLQGIELKLEIS